MIRIHPLSLPRRRALRLAAGSALAAPMLASGMARAADEWPTKPVRYIVVFPPGGPTDTLSRIVCQALSELTGQQFIVENKAGSGGNIGAEAIARSAPDGYTIGLYTVAAHAIAPTLYAKLPFDAAKDFTGIAMLWSVPNMLMTRLDFPANTLAELIATVKANPGKYSFASSGSGTTPHLTGELFKQLAQVNLLHVPYRGSAPAHQDLLAGQVDMMFDNIPGPLGLMRGGKVKGFAVTSKERHPAVPDLPAMAELLPGFEITSWGGICAPAGVPPAMIERLSALCRKALESPSVKEAFDKQGATRTWMSRADTEAFRALDEKRFAPIIKASGAKVD
ncbi:tripartite tricarboxylate transporter substrate binding protein [Reyranella sp. CPCC 100927]|uniref:Bug family tripartite tricarboxylate transporter substrate binding protein n=1 Tax=Reyranella sp. CPCC 100927 TaxID=2599616 RepID=UPI0011B43ADC|nr:tripartite tricarboxylate transporter substrate binding protein [Reyranella sp. CPCC 100927]TWT03125.1 tripartite tricarboxylate transporter substrate binding protein [Reyranella sp. CPCC 100927]